MPLTRASAGVIKTEEIVNNRNLVINGDMRIDQRNAGANVTNSNNGSSFITDRFRGDAPVDQSITFQQQTSIVPAGFTHSLKVTSNTATSNTNNQPALAHFVEGFNTADLGFGTVNAKTITLSFQVYSSLTGTFGVCFENNNSDRAYIASYTINTANTWETKTITIAGDTSGTWEKTNQRGLSIFFDLGFGTTFSSAASTTWANVERGLTGGVKLAANTGATWYITGVQLEVGSVATPFERRPYGMELALCQRYYYKSYEIGVTPGTNTGTGAISGRNWDPGSGRTTVPVTAHHKVEMRTTPTVVFYTIPGLAGSVSQGGDPTAHAGSLAVNATYSLTTKIIAGIDVASAVAASQFFNFHYTASAEL
jgi:hypothetical protein